MKALELVEALLNLVDRHGDLEVKVEYSDQMEDRNALPVRAANFTYNDAETEAWIELDFAG